MPVDTVRTLAEGIMADVTEDLAALVRIPSCAFPGFPSEPVIQTAEAVVDMMLQRFLSAPLAAADRQRLVDFLRAELKGDTVAPGAMLEETLRRLLYLVLSTPAYQLG